MRVGDLYYVWYTQRPCGTEAFASTIYYATSRDGLSWDDRGEAIGRGATGAWNSFGVFTPYVAVVDGTCYLYYTATSAAEPFDVERTLRHIGVALAESPDGPWTRYRDNPPLDPSPDPEAYDSLVVDDTHVIVREGQWWLYFTGRGLGRTSAETQWGMAFADRPTGPFTKYEHDPVLESGHTVRVWPHREGVGALVDLTNTVQYASDGLRFQCAAAVPWVHVGCGPHDPDAFTDTSCGGGISWGVAEHADQVKPALHIVRFDVDLRARRDP